MPVRRVPGGKKSSVYAYRAEIDAWLKGADEAVPPSSIDSIPRPSTAGTEIEIAGSGRSGLWHWSIYVRLLIAIMLAVVIVATGVYLTTLSRPSPPVRVNVTLDSVLALDGNGKELWRHRFPERLDEQLEFSRNSLNEYVRIVDLYGDGEKEVLIVTPRRLGHNDDGAQYQVDCFSGDGKLLWSYVPTADFRFGTHELGGPWHILDIHVSQDRPPKIWVAATHSMWGNSFVSEVDPRTGRGTIRFVNTGIIYRVNEVRTTRGSYLLAAGWNNEHDGGSLAVVPLNRPYAVSPQTPGTRHKCMNCGAGEPDQYLVLPRSELNRALHSYEDSVAGLQVSGDLVVLQKFATRERTPPNHSHLIYAFKVAPDLVLKSVRYDSQYDLLHQRLFEEGKLDHSIENCSERRSPSPIRVWTQTGGWKKQPVPPSGAAL